MNDPLDAFEWRYLSERSQAVHGFYRAPQGGSPARCGVQPVWFGAGGWRGTGSQDEYERAATLPRCHRCVRLLTADRGLPPLGQT